MRFDVQPGELDRAAARLAADAALLETLLVVARLDAAADAVRGTALELAARAAAEALRARLFDIRLTMSACQLRLRDAAHSYAAADERAATGDGLA